MENTKLKKSIALAAVIALVVSIVSIAAISGENLKGAVRGKTRVATPQTSVGSSVNTPGGNTIAPPTSNTPNAAISPVVTHSVNFTNRRNYNVSCLYYMELGKWKMVSNAPLNLNQVPLNSSLNNVNASSVDYKLIISRNENGSAPLRVVDKNITAADFNFIMELGSPLNIPTGTTYFILQAKPSGGISNETHVNSSITSGTTGTTWGSFTQNNQSFVATGGQNITLANNLQQNVKIYGTNTDQLCGQGPTPPQGQLGNLGLNSTLHGTTGLPILYVSSACPVTTGFEKLGQWDLEIDNPFTLKRAKFNVYRNINESFDRRVANDYKVYISTDKTNYAGTALASFTANATTQEFEVSFGNGVNLARSPLKYWFENDTYYLTLEGKPFQHPEANLNESSQGIIASLTNDPNYSWGTFFNGTTYDKEAKKSLWRVTFLGPISPTGNLVNIARSLNQIDAEHPTPSCAGASDPSTGFIFNQTIKEVQISACNNTSTDWVAVFQGTIGTGYQTLALDGIPTVIRDITTTGQGGDEVNRVKVILSTTTDYANTQTASYEMDPPSSWFLMATPGLMLQPLTTTYVTYLVQPNPTLTLSPGANHRVQATWMNNAIAMTKLNNAVIGHFSTANTNTEARIATPNMNVTLTANTAYVNNNQAGKFWLVPCAQ